ARPEATGGTADVVRQAKVTCARRAELADFLDEFWPDPPRQEVFQPEPGCSDATFRGSGAEAMALATSMLAAVAGELASPAAEEPAVALLVALPSAEHKGSRTARLGFPRDVVVADGLDNYEVRISEAALAEIRAWFRRSARVNGPRVETGGLVFGQ